jgi:hypothetical protein
MEMMKKMAEGLGGMVSTSEEIAADLKLTEESSFSSGIF